MNISVILPYYNAEKTIEVQITALLNQNFSDPWEIILINNRSNDGTQKIVDKYKGSFKNIKIVEAFEKQGKSFALNKGISFSDGENLIFCDADDEVGEGYLSAMSRALQKYDFVAARMDHEKLNLTWTRRGGGGIQQDCLGSVSYYPFLPHAGGGTLGMKRKVYEKTGKFDENLKILEDTDFCFRAQQNGISLQYVQDAVLHVRYRDTMKGIYRQATNYGEYNVVLAKKYRCKNNSKKDVIRAWYYFSFMCMNVLKQLPEARDKEKLAKFLWRLGWQVGKFRGAVKHVTIPI